ncbi:hypothetical protein J2Y58_002601 [Sphingomonas sp. BE138]|uniref:SGNH/GDSL hydrolase family protein n=1 Tax=Sphingomonas sp. BE138 TaxID=2817845 RepID=UPI00285FE7F1|nr:hypothetical protein [Sphingomonas sp. BE138]MDR6789230.1 hypothetical protein [Sphingomonas sp. BE138]
MIPFCLILGDSTAVGTAAALAMSGIQCEMRARVGASSSDALRFSPETLSASFVVIALGSNDPRSPKLLQNLNVIRRRTAASRVVWIAPYNPAASAIVRTVAVTFGDTVVRLDAFRTQDGIHPISYRSVARVVGLSRSTLSMTGEQSASPGPPFAVRQAVVVTF